MKQSPLLKVTQYKRSHTLRNICIAIGIVLIRNGIGDLFDHFLFPNHPILSEFISIILGILALYLAGGDAYYLGGYNEDEKQAEEKKHNLKENLLFGAILLLLLIILFFIVDLTYFHRL